MNIGFLNVGIWGVLFLFSIFATISGESLPPLLCICTCGAATAASLALAIKERKKR